MPDCMWGGHGYQPEDRVPLAGKVIFHIKGVIIITEEGRVP